MSTLTVSAVNPARAGRRSAPAVHRRVLAPVLLACLCLVFSDAATSAEASKLTVRFSGLEDFRGELMVSVANSEEMFDSDDRVLLSAEVPVEAKQESAVFEGVEPGEYAVKVFHDANSNRKLDMGMMGPKEKYGFSNNVVGFLGLPDFDDAKFYFDGTQLTIEIRAR